MSPSIESASVAIRRLGPADADAYRSLRLRGLAEHPEAFTSSYDEEAAKPTAFVTDRLAPGGSFIICGAFVGGKLVGVVGLSREARLKNRHKAAVFGMYVAREHGHRGIGRALIRHAVAAAQGEPGLEQLVLTVTQTNEIARALYESEGFRSFGIEPRAIRVAERYYDKSHMVRFLAPE